MTPLRSVKGMHDILPSEIAKWHFVERTYRELVERFGYREVRTPILEPLELFVRGIGEATDIVEKEMYAFEDKGGDRLALRPEGTASAMRAYIQHSVQVSEPLSKWYYVGPMFRRERPAKGRFRQFYQAGAELIGAQEPTADAEIIDMAVQFVERLGIRDVKVQLNSLGDEESRPVYREALVAFFSRSRDALCPDCRRRLEVNPLRILDCKVETCKGLASEAPPVVEHLSLASAEHFSQVRRLLDRYGTPYEVAPRLVRGLDYYTRTIFEIEGDAGELGAQATIVGGGRYDTLVSELGGRPTPAIGFSFGIERLLMIIGGKEPAPQRLVFVAGVGNGGIDRAADLARSLRKAGCSVEASYGGGSLKSQLKRADHMGATVTLIAGEDEAERQSVTWRDMKDGKQHEVPLSELTGRLGEVL
ncbi:MAG: histidine--tRNA ligase [Deltaproteobacteria bacterium]|nr:histidine--tRNA ligase [Deltaproteobacteria bacterium]